MNDKECGKTHPATSAEHTDKKREIEEAIELID